MSDPLARSIELFAAVHMTIIGVSHIVQPVAWVRFFQLLCSHGTTGAFTVGFMSLMLGSVIVAFHNVWEGGAIVLTLLGWAQIVKAAIYFFAPEAGLRSMSRVAPERAWEFQVAGAVLLVIAAWIVMRLIQAT